MRGCITELDFQACDEVFPGIVSYYRALKNKPQTFLELVWAFTHRDEEDVQPLSAPMTRAAAR